MRNNQFGMTVIRFGGAEDDNPEGACVHVYSDSNEVCFALGNAFAAVTMRTHGLYEAPDPMGCRCDVASTDEADEKKRLFARAVLDLEKRRTPALAALASRGGGVCYFARARLQRFTRVVKDYPKEEQTIEVVATSDDVHGLLSAVYMELMTRVRGHDALAAPVEVRVRTNVDGKNPLVGDLENMKQRHGRLRERRGGEGE